MTLHREGVLRYKPLGVYSPPEVVGLEIGRGKITQFLRLAFFLVNYAGGVVKDFKRVVMTKSGFCFRKVQAQQ